MDDSVNGFFIKAGFIITVAWLALVVIKAVGIGAVHTSWWVVLCYPVILLAVIAAILGCLYALAKFTAWICKER